jgi:hypothetical protein
MKLNQVLNATDATEGAFVLWLMQIYILSIENIDLPDHEVCSGTFLSQLRDPENG